MTILDVDTIPLLNAWKFTLHKKQQFQCRTLNDTEFDENFIINTIKPNNYKSSPNKKSPSKSPTKTLTYKPHFPSKNPSQVLKIPNKTQTKSNTKTSRVCTTPEIDWSFNCPSDIADSRTNRVNLSKVRGNWKAGKGREVNTPKGIGGFKGSKTDMVGRYRSRLNGSIDERAFGDTRLR